MAGDRLWEEKRTFAASSIGANKDGGAEGTLLAVSAAAGRQHGGRQLSGIVACVGAVLDHIQALHEALQLRGAVQRAAVADQLAPASRRNILSNHRPSSGVLAYPQDRWPVLQLQLCSMRTAAQAVHRWCF